MSLVNSTAVDTNGLVFYYDLYNPRSYIGQAATNILPNGIYARHPTYPSGWGTYRDRLYNSNSFFSIGSITGITGNIISCVNHPFSTYDVVRPQTTGGGVVADTDYFVRKWDNNSFSLYVYDSTEDSYDIFSTQNAIHSDTPVSVSAGVTNMWRGYPHLPNSGILKQIIKNGFKHKGRMHDCVRLHWFRADGQKDGMAYGNEPSITAGHTYTASFYYRAATPNIVGTQCYFERWTSGDAEIEYFTVGKNWQRFSHTFTTTQSGSTYFYWFPTNSVPAQSALDISEIMITEGSGYSDYISDSKTKSITDLTGNYSVTPTNVLYNADGTVSFDGTGYLDVGALSGSFSQFTVSVWFKSSQVVGYRNVIDCNYAYNGVTGNIGPRLEQNSDGNLCWIMGGITNNNNPYDFYNVIFSGMVAGSWYNAVITRDVDGLISTYINGTLVVDKASNPNGFVNTFSNVTVGRGFHLGQSSERYFKGNVPVTQIYNRAMTTDEVKKNFNAHRRRYGL